MANIRKDKFDLNVIASELEKIKVIKNGIAHFTAFRFEDFITVLQTSLDFNKDIPDVEKRGLVVKSVFECASRGKITRKNILKYVNINENKFIKKPFVDYNIFTSISIKYFNSLHQIRINNNYISFLPHIPPSYNLEQIKIRLKIEGRKLPPHNFTKVIISSKGRTYSEAVNSALDSFELVRGIWNFLVNRLTSRQVATGSVNPVNSILLGPIHSLHNKNGSQILDDYWYEPFFNERTKLYDLSKHYDYIKREEKIIRNKIRKLKYGEGLKRAFIRYNNTLDYQDANYSLLSLWSILEFLTSTTGESYDRTITRTLFLYRDKELTKQILEHLRDVRNKIVHSNDRDDRARYLVFQLKQFVENFLSFHLYNKFHFNSLIDAGKLFDLSNDNKVLRERIKLLEIAYNFKLDNRD